MNWRRYPTKYGNKKTVAHGIQFDSKHEADVYMELRIMQEQGLIHDLKLQEKYVLIPAQYETSNEVYKKGAHKGEPKKGKLIEKEVSYLADFDYYTKEGDHVVADAKGFRTKEYILKRKMMLYIHGIRIMEV